MTGAACVEVTVNGENAGVSFCLPHVINVRGLLRNGKNTVKIKAFNSLFNLLGPNHIEDILRRTGVGPYTFADYKKFTDTNVMLPFGLGNLELLKRENNTDLQ